MRREYKIALGISTCLFMAVFALSYYMDLKSLTVWTTNVWDSLATGEGIRSFYEYSAMNLYNLDHTMVGSDILIYSAPFWSGDYRA